MTDNTRKAHVCPLCKCNKASDFHQLESFGYSVKYYQCSNCGLIFQDVNESQAGDPEFYKEIYRKIYQTSEAPTPKDLRIQQQRAENEVAFLIQNNVKSIKRALDIGASAGELLDTYRYKYACQVVGVEPGRLYREFAEARGIEMFESLEVLLAKDVKCFDLISMMHVLEHVNDPLEMLKGLRENLLTPDGHLLIEVPNFYAHDSFELAHLICFTKHSLIQLLESAGYDIVAVKSHGFPRSKLLNLYLTVLITPNHKEAKKFSVKLDRRVGLKRKIGFFYRRIVQKLFPGQAWLPTDFKGLN
ncbi:MAG: class I SAM-dependent methyltransferase [Anaerolineaceae bacterium]|nr:class I SAM-dependent methyltransferase [Anaerolineaceae bacterium]